MCHKFENYKNCLEATQLQNKINHLEKTTDKDSFFCYKRKHIEFIKNNKLISKTHKKQQINIKNTAKI